RSGCRAPLLRHVPAESLRPAAPLATQGSPPPQRPETARQSLPTPQRQCPAGPSSILSKNNVKSPGILQLHGHKLCRVVTVQCCDLFEILHHDVRGFLLAEAGRFNSTEMIDRVAVRQHSPAAQDRKSVV